MDRQLADFGVNLSELARAFRVRVEQLRRQPFADHEQFQAWVAAPHALAEFFSMPVSDGPIVI
jgi:hypothetical protein